MKRGEATLSTLVQGRMLLDGDKPRTGIRKFFETWLSRRLNAEEASHVFQRIRRKSFQTTLQRDV